MNIAPRAHVLPDVLVPGLRVVFCGSAAGAVSAALGAYYAGPGNLFWPTLYRIGLVPRIIAPADFREVATWGIGLTDLAKTVSGADNILPKGCFDRNGFLERISRVSPRAVAFNGKLAARAALGRSGDLPYGPVAAAGGLPTAFVLPSTSGLARRFWDIGPWCELAAYLAAAGSTAQMCPGPGGVMGGAALTHPAECSPFKRVGRDARQRRGLRSHFGSLDRNGNGQGRISSFQYLCSSLLICVHLRQEILS